MKIWCSIQLRTYEVGIQKELRKWYASVKIHN